MAGPPLGREMNLGTLLPCNVVVYTREDGRTAFMVVDPGAALSMISNPQIAEIAKQIAEKMRRGPKGP